MRKRKKDKLSQKFKRIEDGKEIEFNPADYDYMNDMPLEGWLWEFERRSKEYQRAYSELLKENYEYLDNTVFLNCCHYDPSRKWNEIDQVRFVSLSKANPVEVINLKWRIGSTVIIGKNYNKAAQELGSKVKLKLSEPSEEEPIFINDKGKKRHIEQHPKIQRQIRDGQVILTCDRRHPFSKFYWELDKENIVMALIDISANQKDINEKLESYLDEWRKTLKITQQRKPKKNSPKKNEQDLLSKDSSKWKSYLITYDLVGEPKRDSYKSVSTKLQEYGYNYSSSKNIERYYKTAKKLINGGYKKYL